MPKKICDHTVHVFRDGKSVAVAPNTPFDFTEDELDDIIAAQGTESLRDPRNEDPEAAVAKAEAKPEGKPESKKAAGKKDEL